MSTKGMSGTARAKSFRPVAPDGDGAASRAPTRREFDRLAALVDEIDRRVARDRQDIDMQFQRLAELQAVIDRIQIGAKRRRARRDRAGE